MAQPSVRIGEEMRFSIKLSGIYVGEGKLEVRHNVCKPTPCWYVRVTGRSSKFWSMFIKVKDEWGSYYHPDTRTPSYSYRIIQEGSYTRNETIRFSKKNAHVTLYHDRQLREEKEQFSKKIDVYTQDLISAYYYMRTIPLEGMQAGDSFQMNVFFKDSLYNNQVVFLGKEKIKTKNGRQLAYVLSPEFPENEVVDNKKRSIRVWISANKQRLPLKTVATMYLGHVTITLVEAKNIKP